MVFKTVDTRLGKIALYEKKVPYTLPLILLHGVYFDHCLWNYQVGQIDDRTIITIDMPLHGKSKEQIPSQWSLEDCVHMLIDLLEALRIDSAITVGHSWGSMMLLRAAHQYPEEFQAVGFCNMPFKATTS
ncbi:MAG: alpha/beta hydrolase [Bacteroidota bacterium]